MSVDAVDIQTGPVAWAPLGEPGPWPVTADAGMSMDVEWGAGTARMRVRGEVDAATAPRLRRYVSELADLGVHEFLLDLSGVCFFDCAGLGALVSAKKRLRAVGGDVRVVSASRAVRRVLALSGFAETFGLEGGAVARVR